MSDRQTSIESSPLVASGPIEHQLYCAADTIWTDERSGGASEPVTISSLPVELLQEVFVNHPGLQTHSDIPLSQYHRCAYGMACWPYRWIVVSHVCRRWRAAALQCPRLWRRISATLNVDWTAELLRRSGVVPLEVALDISFPLGRGDRGKSCELILTQLPRIRTLRLSASKPLSARIIQLLSGTAPMLKNLSISLPWTIDLARPEDDESAPFAALIRRERAPRLVSLNIYEVGMHIQGSCSATLKHIFIQLTADSVIRPYAPVFLDALRAMPSLETITFKRCLLSQRQHILPPHSHLRAVELPRLKSINLTTDALECIMLLNEMALPRLTHLAVLSANTCRHGTELALTLAEKICTIGYLSTLYISRYPQFVRVGSGPRTTVNIFESKTGMQPLNLDISMCHCHDADDVISNISFLRPLQAVRSLYVEGSEVSRSCWSAILGGMDQIVRLGVTGPFVAEEFPIYLACRRHTVDTYREYLEPRWQHYLPNLLCLELKGVCFGDVETLRSSTLSAFAANLRASLAIRARHGQKLDELRIRRCVNLHEGTVGALRSVVSFISCGGSVETHLISDLKDVSPFDTSVIPFFYGL